MISGRFVSSRIEDEKRSNSEKMRGAVKHAGGVSSSIVEI
jgi:hypothetical protein